MLTEKHPSTVYEPDNPPWIEWFLWVFGFLLIARTDRIVTVHVSTVRNGYDMNEYRRIHGCSSIWPGFITAYLLLTANGYSYRRRLLGLDFTASLRRANRST